MLSPKGTNIVLDDDLLNRARKYSRARSKRALVREALETYVAAKEAEMKRESYKDKLQRVRRKLAGVRTSQSSQSIVRRDRERSS